MEEKILQILRQIENAYNVKVIYACEAGSRALGLHSTESDYDCRFIYVEPKDRYVSIDPIKKDVIELAATNELDLSGWEITKALRLFRKSNPSLLEWLHANKIYLEPYHTVLELRTLEKHLYSQKACILHYISITSKNRKALQKQHPINVKQALAMISPLLMARSIKQLHVFPSGNFFHLTETITEEQIRSEIESIAREKIQYHGRKTTTLSQNLINWITAEIEELKQYANLLQENRVDCTEQLNNIFRKTLETVWKNK